MSYSLAVVSVAAKDLAIAFSLTSTELPGGNQVLASGERFFPQSCYAALNNSFERTDVQDALVSESQFEDWKVVSARVAPCAPLGKTPTQQVAVYCWPEISLML